MVFQYLKFNKLSLPAIFFLFLCFSVALLFLAEYAGISKSERKVKRPTRFNHELHNKIIRTTITDVAKKVEQEEKNKRLKKQIDQRLIEGAIRQFNYENSDEDFEFFDL